MDDSAELPEWWITNQQLRDKMGLPEYQPPRFRDGTYTHEIVPNIEEKFDIALNFRGFDTNYPDDFTVVVNGEPLFDIGRKRDNAGNTIYAITSEEFQNQIKIALDSNQ